MGFECSGELREWRWNRGLINLQTAFMVGGFAANDWLFNKVKEAVEDYEIDLCRPDNLMYGSDF